MPLKLIGDGDPSLITYGEYLGHMPPSERNRWMAGAVALLAPTEYIEPSACVCTEAQLCGTPVIASNWGGFTEYIEDNATGYLCRDLGEYVAAIKAVWSLDREYVRARARTLYGWDTGVTAYRRYFERMRMSDTVGGGTPVWGSTPAFAEQ
jgi:glycosyltransferase involved in cell wall biosynthesis